MKRCVGVRRADVRASIRFEGLIRGCADHQWLIADALYETGAGWSASLSQRWVVASRETNRRDETLPVRPVPSDRSASPAASPPAPVRIVAYDRLTGWTASAVSPPELARLILQAYGNRPMPTDSLPTPVLLPGITAGPAAFPHPDAA
jgi:hypothetical protein